MEGIERLLLGADSIGERNTLSLNYREEDVADEAETPNLLHRRAESADVGTLAERRFHERDSAAF